MIVFGRTYAGKLEEARDLMEEEKTTTRSSNVAQEEVDELPKELTEEENLREDKKRPYEEEMIPELIHVPPDPFLIDEAKNQTGPSTPRPNAQKIPLTNGSPEPDGKKLKPTTFKTTHDLQAESPESKRLKPNEGAERRLEMTQIGDDIFHHMDQVIGQEDLWSYEDDLENSVEEAKHDIPEALWSDAPLDRVPPDPPKWVHDLADAVEEWRLKRLGALSPLKKF